MKNGKPLKIASISDIHLGHKRVTAETIYNNVRTEFPDSPETGELDLLIVAGDVFDSLQYFNDVSIRYAQLTIEYLLRISLKWNIVLRVLEGTPSHDREQSRQFAFLAQLMGIEDLEIYKPELSIEFNKELDISILYIPDEWNSDNDITWKEVKELLKQNDIEKVDFVVMHGMFNYQLPVGIEFPCHNEENYLSICNRYIFIGHVHNASRFDRILAQGSFDRLRFNEEEPKGHYRVTCHPNIEDDRIEFVENKGATRMDTVSIVGKDTEEAYKALEHTLSLPEGSYIRIEIERRTEHLAIFDSLKARYPKFNWKTLEHKVKASKETNEQIEFRTQAVPINERSIVDLTRNKLDDNNIDVETQRRVLDLLEQYKVG